MNTGRYTSLEQALAIAMQHRCKVTGKRTIETRGFPGLRWIGCLDYLHRVHNFHIIIREGGE